MSPIIFLLVVFAGSLLAGLLGSILGIGGGAIIVPLLTIFFHVPIRIAIAASIVSVIATSSGGAIAYLRDGLTNIRVAMFLELATTTGAIFGALITNSVPDRILFILFAVVLMWSAIAMVRKPKEVPTLIESNDKIANKLKLGATITTEREGKITYTLIKTKIGLFMMFLAGMVSSLLGIGSGVLKVPAMDLVMRMPLKASTATSNFMIGVTAAGSAFIYLAKGEVDPILTAPVAVGVVIGATIGSRKLKTVDLSYLRYLFVIVLFVVSIEMIYKGYILK
jgi:uncharacterized membrane protein YfcA